jgi:4-hydroxy-2-oxoheptanedioate aldolase
MSFKSKLADPSLLLNGQLCVIPSAVATQAIASAGADWIVIDMEHGPIDFAALHAMIAATHGTACAPMVRVPEISEVHVKKALDLGAEGICFPLARTPDDVRRAVASMRYPPQGKRGWGPFIAHSRWDVPLLEYAKGPALETVSMVLIETVDALQNIDAICAVEGVDCFVVAPFDLSTELGVSGQFDHPLMMEAVARIESAVHRAGIPLGGFAFTQEAARAMIARGYRLLGTVDLLSLKAAVVQTRSWLSTD